MSQNGMQTTQTSSATGPSWALPYQQNSLGNAAAQFNSINSPQQLVAPFSPQQNQAITGITNLATNGTPETNAAQNYVTGVLQNGPISNPYLGQLYQQGANQIEQGLTSQFAGAGRNADASLGPQALADSNFASQLYGNAFNTGVQQQENALTQAVPLEQQQFGAQQNLYNAGGAVQNLAQQYIQAPQQFLQNYLNQTNQVPGQSITTQQPYSPALQTANNVGIGSQLGSALGGLFGGSGSTWGGLLGSIGGAFA